jgi:GrpB-like predicted nucleotidyltransferase (UPF0157 family)
LSRNRALRRQTVETLEEKVRRLTNEKIAIVPYDPAWPRMFAEEAAHLRACLPPDLIRRIEHFGSTAVPGLAAKPIIDMLVEVVSLDETRRRIVPLLETQGYDYIWRPAFGDRTPPFYAWFIKRNDAGVRTHHIHMVERHFEHWDRLYFRDYLIAHPAVAAEYQALKQRCAAEHPRNRLAYTSAKTNFIQRVTADAIRFYTRPADNAPGAVELTIGDTLDLHAFNPRDIGAVLPWYLSECRARGLLHLRIIHGKGTGVLQRRVHALLSKTPYVTSYRLAGDGGGWGATLVELRALGQGSSAPPH